MNLSFISNPSNDDSAVFSLNSAERRTVILSANGERLVLPVTPEKYQLQTAQGNSIVDILDSGEALLFGNPKLNRLKFSSFFPAVKHQYSFAAGDVKDTGDCVALIKKWKEQKAPVRVIITDSPVNLMMAIMDFNYSEKDGTRDIYYDLSFTEYRDLNTPQANNPKTVDNLTGLKNRPAADSTISNFISRAQDNLDILKFATGNFSNLNNFLKANSIPKLSVKLPSISSKISIIKW